MEELYYYGIGLKLGKTNISKSGLYIILISHKQHEKCAFLKSYIFLYFLRKENYIFLHFCPEIHINVPIYF